MPCLETEIKFGDFIKCICATKNVNYDGLLMKFKTDNRTYDKYQKDKKKTSLCFNLIDKKVYYVENKIITNYKFPTLDKFSTISQRTNLME
jgi:hypothetical protein